MNKYALIQAGQITRTADLTQAPALAAAKGMVWLELLEPAPPAYDPATHGIRESAPLITDWSCTRQWEVFPLPVEDVEEIAAAQVAKARAQAKAARAQAVEAITVTTAAGNVFDGDETSQNRMARAVIALHATGTPSITWTLADNTTTQATAAELTEALALAGAAQSALWTL